MWVCVENRNQLQASEERKSNRAAKLSAREDNIINKNQLIYQRLKVAGRRTDSWKSCQLKSYLPKINRHRQGGGRGRELGVKWKQAVVDVLRARSLPRNLLKFAVFYGLKYICIIYILYLYYIFFAYFISYCITYLFIIYAQYLIAFPRINLKASLCATWQFLGILGRQLPNWKRYQFKVKLHNGKWLFLLWYSIAILDMPAKFSSQFVCDTFSGNSSSSSWRNSRHVKALSKGV